MVPLIVSVSPDWKPAEMMTVALCKLALSASVTLKPGDKGLTGCKMCVGGGVLLIFTSVAAILFRTGAASTVTSV